MKNTKRIIVITSALAITAALSSCASGPNVINYYETNGEGTHMTVPEITVPSAPEPTGMGSEKVAEILLGCDRWEYAHDGGDVYSMTVEKNENGTLGFVCSHTGTDGTSDKTTGEITAGDNDDLLFVYTLEDGTQGVVHTKCRISSTMIFVEKDNSSPLFGDESAVMFLAVNDAEVME